MIHTKKNLMRFLGVHSLFFSTSFVFAGPEQSTQIALPGDATQVTLSYVKLSQQASDEVVGQTETTDENVSTYSDKYGKNKTVAVGISYLTQRKHMEYDTTSDGKYFETGMNKLELHFARELFTADELKDIAQFRLVDRERKARVHSYFNLQVAKKPYTVVKSVTKDSSDCYKPLSSGEEIRTWGCEGKVVKKSFSYRNATITKR